eukprot:TRINITY_DN36_c5_g1_i1.p1 TRINITY_DN36_c5_g1~~TRINITY_DN36_c5_g1_i1.p1  ORF type:complete len:607 (-),score=182.57 TRINITY_DN36_c5_g1_i1:218-2038(-)
MDRRNVKRVLRHLVNDKNEVTERDLRHALGYLGLKNTKQVVEHCRSDDGWIKADKVLENFTPSNNRKSSFNKDIATPPQRRGNDKSEAMEQASSCLMNSPMGQKTRWGVFDPHVMQTMQSRNNDINKNKEGGGRLYPYSPKQIQHLKRKPSVGRLQKQMLKRVSRNPTRFRAACKTKDGDYDGKVTHGEFRSVLNDLDVRFDANEVQALIEQLDKTGGGTIDYEGMLESSNLQSEVVSSPKPGIKTSAPWMKDEMKYFVPHASPSHITSSKQTVANIVHSSPKPVHPRNTPKKTLSPSSLLQELAENGDKDEYYDDNGEFLFEEEDGHNEFKQPITPRHGGNYNNNNIDDDRMSVGSTISTGSSFLNDIRSDLNNAQQPNLQKRRRIKRRPATAASINIGSKTIPISAGWWRYRRSDRVLDCLQQDTMPHNINSPRAVTAGGSINNNNNSDEGNVEATAVPEALADFTMTPDIPRRRRALSTPRSAPSSRRMRPFPFSTDDSVIRTSTNKRKAISMEDRIRTLVTHGPNLTTTQRERIRGFAFKQKATKDHVSSLLCDPPTPSSSSSKIPGTPKRTPSKRPITPKVGTPVKIPTVDFSNTLAAVSS